MHRLLIIFLLIFSISEYALSETYQITALTSPSIAIGGKLLKKGDRFSGESPIKWDDSRQTMEVKALSTGKLYMLSRKVFESKGKVHSLADYFLKTTAGSSRGDNGMPIFTESNTKNDYPEKRIALVMGNSGYAHFPYLKNALKDASDVAETLKTLGFDVVEIYESDYVGMKTALNNFSAKSKFYDVALFYFAGHGVQENKENYLVPVERWLSDPEELRSCLNCNDVLTLMQSPTKLMFVDACRVQKVWDTTSSDDGMAYMEGPVGSVIVFSTQIGEAAKDVTDGDNSPFAQAFLKNITIPGISFNEAMDGLVRDTYMLTDHQQFPMKVGTILIPFNFNSSLSMNLASKVENAEEKLSNAREFWNKHDYAEAMNIYSPLAENGISEAQFYLGWMYEMGLGVDTNLVEALKWYRKSALQGYPDAQNCLGLMYLEGKGVGKDPYEAARWIIKSANQGDPNAQCNLGRFYDNGIGVDQDRTESAIWYRRSAEQGDAFAQSLLGGKYYRGDGVEINEVEAEKWCRKGAEQGNALGQYNLGFIYEHGLNGRQDYIEALKWYKMSADQGHYIAQFSVGCMYRDGLGVEENHTEAIKWFRKSAEQGDALAQYYLACAYEEGDGVPQDLEEAVKWYKKAADNGDWSAQDWVKNYEASRKSLIKVTGRVFDEDGIAVVNATLTIVRPQNSQSGNASELPEGTSDFNGRFTLDDVPDGSILNVSYTDYKPASVKVTTKNCKDLKITLNNR